MNSSSQGARVQRDVHFPIGRPSFIHSEICQQKVEQGGLKVLGRRAAAKAVALGRIHQQTVRLARGHERVHHQRGVHKVHVLVNQPVRNQQAAGPAQRVEVEEEEERGENKRLGKERTKGLKKNGRNQEKDEAVEC